MVMAQDEPPVVTGVAADAAYREGNVPVILAKALTLTDADDTMLEGATVTITGGLEPNDSLTVGGVEVGSSQGQFGSLFYIVWYYDRATGTLTFEGQASLADYQEMLRLVAFSSVSDTPGATRTIDWTVNDGDHDSLSRTTHLAVKAVNDHPVLVGLAPSLTIAEHDAPHLLDTNVTFSDSEGNFDGGSLRVSGLLAEDRIAVRDQGAAPGQIGISGSDISYGGTIIGSLSGGAGTTLVVTFNGAASAAAVDALIQNLTYATAGAAPAASRTLFLNVFDAAGADLGPVPGPTAYAGPAGATDPFHGLDVGFEASPAFVDLDNDGKLDLVVGNAAGRLHSFHNNGDGSFTELVGAANPFQAVNLLSFAAPAFADIDGDGDLDAVIGSGEYPLRTFRNDNGVFTELSGADNPFPGFVGFSRHVTFVDLDNDGDPDALSVDLSGSPVALRNDGGIFTELSGNPLNGANVAFDDRTNLVDMDGDGDLDLVLGNDAGHLHLYRNDDGVFTEVTGAADPFRNLDFGADAVPTFADLDGDGNLDVVVGAPDGTLHWLDNVTPRGAAIMVDVIAQNDAPSGTDAVRTIGENGSYSFDASDFGFADGEGNAFSAIILSTMPTSGSILLDGIALQAGQVIAAADISHLAYVPAAGGASRARFTFQVQDNGGTANGGQDTDQSPNSFTFDVAAVNAAPSGADARIGIGEDMPRILSPSDFGFDDADGNKLAAVTIDSVSGGAIYYDPDGAGGAAPALQTLPHLFSLADLGEGKLSFVPAANLGGAAVASLTFRVQDDGGVAFGGIDTDPSANRLSFDIAPVNDAPIVDLDAGMSPRIDTKAAYTEGDPPIRIAPLALVSDPDQPADYAGYKVTAEFTANGTGDDRLTIIGPGEIEVAGNAILYQGVQVATFTGGTGVAALVVTFGAPADARAVELVTASIAFANVSDTPSTLDRTITFTVDDGAGGTATAHAVIGVTAADDEAVARPDILSTSESGPIAHGNVITNDSDVDGPQLQVAEVNGDAANVGKQIVLASGALLILRADGSYDYDPNGKFNTLTSAASGET
ncbi:MAG: hypothetical protein QOH81_205, partial [Sphingomonadales bacterium]|nr:hypothetical protein [Sphingomonadales bacterium]